MNILYYMHNEEMPRFSNKLKVIITSGLRRFISANEIYFSGSTFPMHSVHTKAGTLESHCSVVDDVTSTASRKMSTTFRMQAVRLGGNVEIKITRT